ncbi:MAG: glutamate racemase [Clostridia bacterium]|nr:glutamate racemase [Clostridia bacterium]
MKIPTGGVAFFDSGIGGLTVLNACRKLLPNEIFYYYGDNARAPYGNLPPKKILQYTLDAFALFKRLQVKATVLACNTVTALCVERLREKYSFPIIGAEPAVFPAAKEGGDVFVLTTRATFNSSRFQLLCKRASDMYPQTKLILTPCDGLAAVIEERLFDERDFSFALPQGQPNAVVLGCTHYVYIKEQIEKYYGVPVYDGNKGIAERLKTLINGLETKKNRDGQPPFKILSKKIGIFDHKKPVECNNEKTRNKTNKCSPLKKRKILEICGIEGNSQVFFLGSGKEKNSAFYERMFGF